jgi:hypothetical protein
LPRGIRDPGGESFRIGVKVTVPVIPKQMNAIMEHCQIVDAISIDISRRRARCTRDLLRQATCSSIAQSTGT